MSLRLLLDTHAFLWLATDDPRLSKRARTLAGDRKNALWLSAASVWEIAIKSSLGKLELDLPLETFFEDQMEAMSLQPLDVERRHALVVADLPFHHRDPFDRLLLAQARIEGLQILSRDAAFDAYFDGRVW